MDPVRPLLVALVACLAAAGIAIGVPGDPGPPAAPPLTCADTGPYVAPPPDSVGVPAGLRLCAVRGPIEVRTAGTVLDGLDVTGGVVVAAEEVVVRRSRITGDGGLPAGVRTLPGGSVRIEDATLTGDFADSALAGADWTAERVELTGLRSDGARLGAGATLRNSLLHAFVPPADREIDAVTVAGSGALVEGNRVWLGSGPGAGSAVLVGALGGTTAVHQSPRLGAADAPAVVRGNELAGGRWTLQATDARTLPVLITGNRFRRDAASVPIRLRGNPVELRDNVFVDGGAVRR